MSVQVSPNLPANVVEIGNEISQAKINEINSGTLALQSWVNSGYVSYSYLNSQSYATQSFVSSAISGLATTSWVQQSFVPNPGEGQPGVVYDAPYDGNEYVRKNNAWAIATSGSGGITDAPSDGTTYGRNNGAWVSVGSGGGISDAPVDDQTYVRVNGTWSLLSSYLSYQSYATQSWVASQGYLQQKTIQSVSSGYTIQAGDQNKVLLFTTTMGYDTINLPPDSIYAFPDGTEITVCQYQNIAGNQIAGYYAGQPTINGTSSVLLTQTVHKLVKIGYDQWLFA